LDQYSLLSDHYIISIKIGINFQQFLGNPAAPILLEEFLDLQCIKCQAAHPTIKQVLAHYGPDKIYYIQHINPLDLHRQAWDAAKVCNPKITKIDIGTIYLNPRRFAPRYKL
jgi:hypothetical protein